MRISLYTKPNQMLIDAAIAAASWCIAYLIRYQGLVSPAASREMLVFLVPIAIGQILTSFLFGIYRFQWRYVNTEDALYIARAYLVYAGFLIGITLLAGSVAPGLRIPISIILTTCVLSLVGAISARLARRVLYQYERSSIGGNADNPQRFLIIGAGAHGAMVAREMLQRKGIDVIGFLDDAPEKQDAVIAGVPVLGRVADLPYVTRTRDVDEVLVCISPKSRQSLHIGDARTSTGLPVRSRIMPTLDEILQTTSVISVLSGVNEPPGSDGHTGGTLTQSKRSNVAVTSEPVQATLLSGGNGHGNGGHLNFNPGGNGNGDGAHTTFKPGGNGNGNGVHATLKSGGNGNGDARKRTARISSGLPRISTSAPAVRNQSILITGGAGFIGSSLAERLVEHNRVILFDQSFDGGPIQYTTLLRHPNVTKVQGSILEADLSCLVQDADVVVHTAAILGVNRVCNSSRETLETNYVGTSRLLKALDAKHDLQRFVYFSTSEVFGVNSYRVDEATRPNIGPIAESRWCYAMSKLAGEHLVASYSRETHLPIAIVRPFNIFGPRRTGDYALRRFILNALQDAPLEIHGDGTQIRSWCYIEDFCSAVLQMIARPEATGEDFNIGHPGNTLTIYELAQKVIQLTGSSSTVTFCESPFPDISIRVPSLDKARRLLGYEPKYDLNTGLKHTIDWHRQNLDLLRPPMPPARTARIYAQNEQVA